MSCRLSWLSFDPASIAILDRLNQVLSRLDNLPSSPSHGISPHAPAPISADAHCQGPQTGLVEYNETNCQTQSSSTNGLSMPAAQTSLEAVLRWPILSSRYPPGWINDAVFESEMVESDSDEEGQSPGGAPPLPRSKRAAFDEDDVLRLVQRFLELVHIKNPVLDADTLWSYARRVAEDGLNWDPASCLVVSCRASIEGASLRPPASGLRPRLRSAALRRSRSRPWLGYFP